MSGIILSRYWEVWLWHIELKRLDYPIGHFTTHFHGNSAPHRENHPVIRLWSPLGPGDSDYGAECRFSWRKKIAGGGGVTEKPSLFRTVLGCSCSWPGRCKGSPPDCRWSLGASCGTVYTGGIRRLSCRGSAGPTVRTRYRTAPPPPLQTCQH